MAGKPLLYWTCKAAKESKYIDEVYVSTEDAKIKEVVQSLKLGVKIIDRPAEFAQDTSSTESVMLHFATLIKDFNVLNLIQATSPFTTSEDLDQAIELFFENGWDSMLTGILYKKFYWTLWLLASSQTTGIWRRGQWKWGVLPDEERSLRDL